MPDAWGLARRAVPKAWNQRGWRLRLTTLWREGDNWTFNGWTMVLMALMLIIAGASIPLAHLFSFDEQAPAFLVMIHISWLCIAGAGWSYNVATAKRQPLMVVAAILLFFLLSLGAVVTASV